MSASLSPATLLPIPFLDTVPLKAVENGLGTCADVGD